MSCCISKPDNVLIYHLFLQAIYLCSKKGRVVVLCYFSLMILRMTPCIFCSKSLHLECERFVHYWFKSLSKFKTFRWRLFSNYHYSLYGANNNVPLYAESQVFPFLTLIIVTVQLIPLFPDLWIPRMIFQYRSNSYSIFLAFCEL